MRILLPALLSCLTLNAETYIVGLLQTPATRPSLSKEAAATLQKAHMEHINHMAKIGALVGAGPVYEAAGPLRGIFIFRNTSLDRARELSLADPKVKAGDLEVKLIEWDGPAGVGDRYKKEHEDPAAKTKMIRLQLGLVRRGEIPKNNIAQGKVRGGGYTGLFVMDAGTLEAARQSAQSPNSEIDWYGWMVADGVLP